jgi:serine phosphatase RsbU (regulator of sigma subunit)
VPEATSESGEQFSDERLQSMLQSWNGTAEQLLQLIVNSVSEFTHGAHQHDDITMLASHRYSV